MRRWACSFVLLALSIWTASALEVKLVSSSPARPRANTVTDATMFLGRVKR